MSTNPLEPFARWHARPRPRVALPVRRRQIVECRAHGLTIKTLAKLFDVTETTILVELRKAREAGENG